MRRSRSLLRAVRNKFVAGLIILVPMVITVQALWWLFSFVDDFAKPVAVRVVGHEIPGIGVAMTLAVVMITGLLFAAGPLHRLVAGLDEVVESIPLVGIVYATTKKVAVGLADLRSREAFKRFVLARLPGRTTPGFLTGTFELRRGDGTREPLCMVYVPTNHLYIGDVVVLPAADVLETDLSVEDGISLILSAGASTPAAIGELEHPAPAAAERRAPRKD
jgi:uncharacterized membrane protein